MELQLFENALDFIDSAIEYANSGNKPRNIKYALINLYNGIELLLKAKLKSEDWRLIFVNYDKADEDKLKTGDFKSIGLEDAIERLGNCCDIAIDKDYEKILIQLKKNP